MGSSAGAARRQEERGKNRKRDEGEGCGKGLGAATQITRKGKQGWTLQKGP